jgi:16S rRNA (cytosine967-C5)-methyltransferase
MRVKRKCLDLIARIEQDGAYTHLVLQRVADSGELSPQEYPVLLQLVRGTLEQRGVIEAQLNQFLPKGLHSLPNEVQILLKLSAYQIMFLDRVKKRDVVYEAVDLVKAGRYRGLAGLINAVLRKIEPDSKSADGRSSFDNTSNFPDWLIKRWNEQHGSNEVEKFCAVGGAQLPVYCRINNSRISAKELKGILAQEQVLAEEVDLSPNSLRLREIPASVRITNLKSYQEGLFFIQDASSTIVADIVAMDNPLKVRDLCAAPGGKACSIALSILSQGGEVHASDRAAKRVALIGDLASRLRLKNIKTGRMELSEIVPHAGELFDSVLLDVPCSGFGTVGRKIDVRWSMSEIDLQGLQPVQSSLLRAASRFVRPGGILVYSTCSIDCAENEDVVDLFVASTDEFERVDLRETLDHEICTERGYFRSWPHRHEMAGAFAAKLKRSL